MITLVGVCGYVLITKNKMKPMQRLDQTSHIRRELDDRIALESSESTSPPPQGPLSPDPTYKGHPEIVGLTSIQPKIRITRIEGTDPMMVSVGADETAWVGPAKGHPFTHLEFTWNFGDPAGTEVLDVPKSTPAATVNANTGQQGPMAAYVYRTPGTKTITLTARGWNGSAMVVATTTTVVRLSQTAVKRTAPGTTGAFKLRVERGVKLARAAVLPSTTSRGFLLRQAGHTAVPGGSTGFCMFGWFALVADTSEDHNLPGVYRNNAGNQTMHLRYRGTRFSAGVIRLTVGGTTIDSTTTGVQTGDHFVAAWVDTVAGKLSISIDGGAATETTFAGAIPAGAGAPIVFSGYMEAGGTLNSVRSAMFLDEWGVLARVPTGPEIAWLYNEGRGQRYHEVAAGMPSLLAGLKAWWGLDEEWGTRFDLSGNGNHLTADVRSLAPNSPPVVLGKTAICQGSSGFETADIPFDARGEVVAAALDDALVAADPTLNATRPNVRVIYDDVFEFGGGLAGEEVVINPIQGTFDGVIVVQSLTDAVAPTNTVTVRDWSVTNYPTYYFDLTYDGSAGVADGTEARPFATVADLRSHLLAGGGCRRLMLKAGQTFAMAAGEIQLASKTACIDLQVRKWGVGANPVIRVAGGLSLEPNRDAVRDVCFDGVDIVNSVAGVTIQVKTAGGHLFRYTQPHRGVHFLGCRIESEFESNYGNLMEFAGLYMSDMGIWRSRLVRSQTLVNPDSITHVTAIDSDFLQVLSVVGSSFEGGGGADGAYIFAHHVYTTVASRTLFSLTDFRPLAQRTVPVGGQYSYKSNFNIKFDAKNGNTTPFNLVNQCHMGGTQNGMQFGPTNSSLPNTTIFDLSVVQGTAICRDTDTVSQQLGIWVAGNKIVTIRDCRFWDFLSPINIMNQFSLDSVDASIYRNRAYVPSGGTFLNARHITGLEVTDNKIMSAGASSRLVTAEFTRLAAVGAKIGRNQYYAPDRPDGVGIFGNYAAGPSNPVTTRTLAQWQDAGYDLDAIIAPPGWLDPANGDFRPSAIPVPTVTYVVTGPPALVVGVEQTYTITPSGDATGIRVIPALTPAANGVIATMPPAFSGSTPVTFRVTITTPASVTLSTTNNGGLANPAPLVYEVQPTPADPLPDPPPTPSPVTTPTSRRALTLPPSMLNASARLSPRRVWK